jgi:hypothetical protein
MKMRHECKRRTTGRAVESVGWRKGSKRVYLYVKSLRGKVNEEGRGGWIWLVYFQYLYERGALKPVKVILRRGSGKRENNGGDEPNQVHCIHTCKCHNKTLCITMRC